MVDDDLQYYDGLDLLVNNFPLISSRSQHTLALHIITKYVCIDEMLLFLQEKSFRMPKTFSILPGLERCLPMTSNIFWNLILKIINGVQVFIADNYFDISLLFYIVW